MVRLNLTGNVWYCEMSKNAYLIGGIVVACVFAGYVAGCGIGSGERERLAREYAESVERSRDAITGLEQTIGELRTRIDRTEASNRRLQELNDSARRISGEALAGNKQAASNISEAIAIIRKNIIAIKAIEDILSSGDSSRSDWMAPVGSE